MLIAAHLLSSHVCSQSSHLKDVVADMFLGLENLTAAQNAMISGIPLVRGLEPRMYDPYGLQPIPWIVGPY